MLSNFFQYQHHAHSIIAVCVGSLGVHWSTSTHFKYPCNPPICIQSAQDVEMAKPKPLYSYQTWRLGCLHEHTDERDWYEHMRLNGTTPQWQVTLYWGVQLGRWVTLHKQTFHKMTLLLTYSSGLL